MFAVSPTPVPSPTPTALAPDDQVNRIPVFLSVTILTATFVSVQWEFDAPTTEINTIKSVRIKVSDIVLRANGMSSPNFELVLPANLDNYTLGILEAGTDLTFSISINDTRGDIDEVRVVAIDGRTSVRVFLPGNSDD